MVKPARLPTQVGIADRSFEQRFPILNPAIESRRAIAWPGKGVGDPALRCKDRLPSARLRRAFRGRGNPLARACGWQCKR
jgi:hypothetical protein